MPACWAHSLLSLLWIQFSVDLFPFRVQTLKKRIRNGAALCSLLSSLYVSVMIGQFLARVFGVCVPLMLRRVARGEEKAQERRRRWRALQRGERCRSFRGSFQRSLVARSLAASARTGGPSLYERRRRNNSTSLEVRVRPQKV